jgi:hypothetical protein
MALAKGSNSYATVEEADLYFADRLDVAAWTEADAIQKSQSLVTATSILDDQAWTGVAVSETQPLAFPRSGTYFDPRVNSHVSLADTPLRVVKATYEMAHHLLNNDGILDDTGSVTNLSVSSVNLSTITAPNLIPQNVKRLIKPLLTGGGSNMWWRAN